jgi:hypothetical protein
LPEKSTQFLFQGGGIGQEQRERVSTILQPFDMSDESASLDSEKKLFRCPFIPALKNLLLGKAIKGHIQFHRVKIFGVEFKPLFLGEVGGIKDAIPPMGIVITACSDQNHIMDCRLWIADCGIFGHWNLPFGTYLGLVIWNLTE